MFIPYDNIMTQTSDFILEMNTNFLSYNGNRIIS